MIEHSLVNVFQNAIHALSLADNPRIITRVYRENNSVCLEIEDNGCGIPSEYIDNIYDPSFSLKGSQDTYGRYKEGIKGTGYGMANVKKYIELHKGSINVESALDSGTTILVKLPLPPDGRDEKEVDEVPEIPQHAGKRLLVVEDEPAFAEVQRKLLTHKSVNHHVDIAPNGQAAFELLSKNEYDLISLDYMLPGKINGMDVYSHIRGMNSSVPVLFLSGNIEFLESIETLICNDQYLRHLSKPCLGADYLNKINELIEYSSK
jgi:CheY-like chemotaxis protein